MQNELENLQFRPRSHVTPKPEQRSGLALWLIIFTSVIAAIITANLIQLGFAVMSLDAATDELKKRNAGRDLSKETADQIKRVFHDYGDGIQAIIEKRKPMLLPAYGSPEAARQRRACISGTAMSRAEGDNGWRQEIVNYKPVRCRDH